MSSPVIGVIVFELPEGISLTPSMPAFRLLFPRRICCRLGTSTLETASLAILSVRFSVRWTGLARGFAVCNSLFPGYTDLSTLFLYFRRFVVVGVFDNGILLPYGPSSLFFGALVLLVLSRPTEVASPVLVPVPAAVLALI